MVSTIIVPGEFSDYSSRRVTIEVTGGCHRKMMRMAKYTKTIPYSCLSQTIQAIHRLGGKITLISLSPTSSQVSEMECVEPVSEIGHIPAPQPQEAKNSGKIRQVTKLTNSKQYTFIGEW